MKEVYEIISRIDHALGDSMGKDLLPKGLLRERSGERYSAQKHWPKTARWFSPFMRLSRLSITSTLPAST